MSTALPGVLQACFIVESERFAWWGVDDPATAAADAGLPRGASTLLPMALPTQAGDAIAVTEVPARLVDGREGLAALAAWQEPATGAAGSLVAWSRIARTLRDRDGQQPTGNQASRVLEVLVREMPTAGHAALGLDGTTIWSAEATVQAVELSAGRPASHEPLLDATLRPYQRAGVAWLHAAAAHGGGVLADEMGLGKTVQAIAVLAARREHPNLVVCPTSVVGNWAREFARFAPNTTVVAFTGQDRARILDQAVPGAVVLTSFGVLRSDASLLAERRWDTVVVDEAQQIKNPDAIAARALRALDADLRIAMTGTPVENRLDELWSLLAFTNPGVLGTRARFRSRFSVAVEQRRSTAAAERLHELVAPHILRRRKSDVAPELPPKIESTVVCAMTAEQEVLYRTSMDSAFAAGLGSGVERRGRVLALLTRLKQICNHPEQVEATGSPLMGRSGKLDRATEVLAEIIDNGERALVFTQYRQTGELLSRHLRDQVTGSDVPFLHGGLSMPARENMIAQFQENPEGSPILILSLRAAGFGLTLTRATHVLHFDRWWNPAVEDQASDRAHRIGQTRTVTVHTLVTERTVEEAIADMHDGKRRLAGVAFGDSQGPETDLARLSDDQLRALLEPTGTTR